MTNTTTVKLLNTLRVMVYHSEGLESKDVERLTNIAVNHAVKLHHELGIDRMEIRCPQIDAKNFIKRLPKTNTNVKSIKAAKDTQFQFVKDCVFLFNKARDLEHFRDMYQTLLYHIHTIHDFTLAEI